MKNRIYSYLSIALTMTLLVLATSCERELDELEPAEFPTTGEVFIDGFSAGLNYSAFGGSDVTAFQVDTEVKFAGTSSMRIAVPDFEDPAGAYAGGSYFTDTGRDLSGYNVLTFWARASQPASIDVIGFGNDLGENRYQASIAGLAVNTNWKKYYIPIPDPSKLTEERGMFFFSEGPENERGYTFWIDEVRFESLGTIRPAVPTIFNGEDRVIDTETGSVIAADGFTSFNLPTGVDQRIETAPAYFTYTSSNPGVASVSPTGLVSVMDEGSTVITARIGDTEATGSLTVNSSGEAVAPMTRAPVPTVAEENVISIFSNAYTDEPVDFYNGFWQGSTTLSFDIQIDNDDIIRYTNLNFVGIQFTAPTINATAMNRIHLDIWTPDATDAPAEFKILLFDVGPDGAFGTSDDAEHEVSITSPTLQTASWVSIDLPLTDFPGLTSRNNLAQVVLSGDLPNVYIDNLYLYNDGGTGQGGMPTVAAPTPTQSPMDVISVFSDAFTDIEGTDLNPDWGQATIVTQEDIAGNNTLKYDGLNYQGIQLGSSQNLSEMDFLHLDVWTDNSSELNVYLISPGPEETAFSINVPTAGWSSLDIPMSAFAGVDLADVIQLKFDGNGTIFLDNIFFFQGSDMGDMPTTAAPVPTNAAQDVISVFSDSYTNIDGSNLNPDWGQATVVSEVDIAGNNTLLYSGLNYQGLQLGSTQNVSEMEFVHLDFWTANSTTLSIFLISEGPVEEPFSLTVPTSGWGSVDIPLSAFAPVDLSQVIQFKFEGDGDIYLDNLFFFKESDGMNNEPTTAAPTPTLDAANVISLFSEPYMDVPVDTWRTEWSNAVFADVTVDGNATKKYSELNFVGIETVANQIDATGMTHFHIDAWSADFTYFAIKLVDFGADGEFEGGDDVEHEIQFTMPATGEWISYDIPLSDFIGLTTRANIAQLILVGQPTDANTVFVDNVYFHN